MSGLFACAYCGATAGRTEPLRHELDCPGGPPRVVVCVNDERQQGERPVTTDAHELVNGDRNADYGHPLDDFTRVGDLWAVEFGHPVTAEQVARCLVMLKLAREMHVPKRDNRVDLAGYAETLDMVITERERRGNKLD